MKQLLFSILFFAIIFSGCGQQNSFSVSGKVIDCRTNEPIKNATIKLVGTDNTSIDTKSDSLGNYSFANCFKNNTNYVLTTQIDATVEVSPDIKYGTCPYIEHEKNGYLNSSEKYKFFFSDTLKKLTHDFCLSPLNSCDWLILPDFFFKKNSTDFENIEWIGTVRNDTIIDCLVNILMAKKNWVLELSAHSSSDETNKKQLAEARAKKVFHLLVSKGINPKRLYCKAYSDTRPFEFRDFSGEIIPKDKKFINEKSRRVVFSVLRKDFGIEEQKNINQKESEEE